MTQRIALLWQVADFFGWGVFGLNLTLDLLKRGTPRPLLLRPANLQLANPLVAGLLAPLIQEQQHLQRMCDDNPGHRMRLTDTIVLCSLGNNLVAPEVAALYQGDATVGVVFSERTRFDPAALAEAGALDGVIAGSTWNGDVLRAQGLDNVRVVFQGVDTELFRPVPGVRGLLGDRFAVFSGGKLEYRKGQDIVLAAFRTFRQRHPDAVLVTCWQNLWPETVDRIAAAGHVTVAPAAAPGGGLDIAGWVRANGLPADSVVDLGVVPNVLMPQVLRQMDAAVFASRCEGGTNLVAMECLACGVPCVLSANTGHLDLIADGTCYPLRDQAPVPDTGEGTDGWGDSSVDEVVAALEAIYADPAEAGRRAAAAADRMAAWSWAAQTGRLLEALP